MSSQPKESGKRSWGGRTLLIASLAANVFLAGVLVGNSQRGPGKGAFGPGPMGMPPLVSPMDFRRIVSDPEVGDKLKSTLDELRPQMRSAMRGSFEARRAILDAIKSEPFDPEGLSAAFEGSRQADDAVRLIAQESIQSFIASLTPEERSQISTELETMPMRPMGPRGRFRDRDGKDGFPMGPRDRFGPAGGASEGSDEVREE